MVILSYRQQEDEVVEENPPPDLTEFVDPPLDDWPALNFKFIDQVDSLKRIYTTFLFKFWNYF